MDNNKVFKIVIILFSIFICVLTKDKPVKEDKATALTMLHQYIDLSSLDVLDYIRFLALIVAFIAVVFYDCGGLGFRKGVDLAIFFQGFVAFFFPRAMLSTFTTMKIDVTHQFLEQNIGIISMSISCVGLLGSPSNQVEGARILTRFMALLALVLVELMAHFQGSVKFTQQHMLLGVSMLAMMCLGHLYYIYKRGDFGRQSVQYSLNSGFNVFIMLDIVVLTLGFVTDMAYSEATADFIALPGWKMDALHIHMVKVGGILEFAMILYSVMTLSFADDRDKRDLFYQRLMTISLGTLIAVLYQLKHGMFSSNGFIASMVFCFVLAVNTIWALFGNPVTVLSNVASPQMTLRRKKVT